MKIREEIITARANPTVKWASSLAEKKGRADAKSFIAEGEKLTFEAIKSKHFKMAKQAVLKSGNYAFAGRKMKKRDFRSLWITRISAQAKVCGMNYSTLMHGLKVCGIDLNRKMLAELAVSDKEAFAAICEKAKAAL